MIYSYCVDEEDRVISICPDDLTGSTGWYRGDIPISPTDDLTDDHGAALYKAVDGVIVPRSQAEREADWPVVPEPELEPEHRMTVQEMQEAIAALTSMEAKDNIAKGSYFVLRDEVYQATRAIVKGSEIKPGYNCAKKSLNEAIQ